MHVLKNGKRTIFYRAGYSPGKILYWDHLLPWNATFVISFNWDGILIGEKVGDEGCSSDWGPLYITSSKGVRSIIPLIWWFLLVDGTDGIADLIDWKFGTIVEREGLRNELNQSKCLPSEVSEVREISLIVIFLGVLGSGIISSLRMVISFHFSLSGT